MSKKAYFDPKAVGRRLQEGRADLSQRELGKSLGYLQPHISRYERGDVPGSFCFLAGLSALHGINVDWLLTGQGPRRIEEADGQLSDGALAEAVKRVLAVVQSARETSPGSDRLPGMAGSAGQGGRLLQLPTWLEQSWDRVQLELPFLLVPLFSASSSDLSASRSDFSASPSGRAEAVLPTGDSRASEGERAGEDHAMKDLLQDLEGAARSGDVLALLRAVTDAARPLEEGTAGPLDLERARFLLVWAWLLADSRAREMPGLAGESARILYSLARVTRKAGRLVEAEGIYRAALSCALSLGEGEVVARCHAGLGNIHFQRGEFDSARSEYVALLEEALRLGDPQLLFRAYLDLAAYYHEGRREYGKAGEYATAGLEIARREGDLEHAGRFLNELGLSEMELGNRRSAEAYFEEAGRIAHETGSALLLAVSRTNLGELRVREESYDEAIALLREGLSAAAQAGLVWAECQAEILIARALHGRGQSAAALERLERTEARCVTHGLNHERELARSLEREIQLRLLGQLQALSS
jgi:tetratricopeptide (TPR) repeat protein/transcriptional regulator with XRE-family HTH domain